MTNILSTKYSLECFKNMKVHHLCQKCKKYFTNDRISMKQEICPSCLEANMLIIKEVNIEELSLD